MKPVIDIRNLGKQYQLHEAPPYVSLRDILSQSVKKFFSSPEKNETFWALRDINLQIEPGERVGIIGRNGAGKSTLLKIISRITPPTIGEAFIRGRVGSLLEVGTGFHPELTGRENIYLNGSILGLRKTEITRQLDAIIDFSGVAKFIDSPLKHYSSGMQLRLAFSVAAHLEPEILLIDEVLAVGDLEFQKKCLGKMEEVSKKDGRTILFVSHDLNVVSKLTTQCILLDQGIVIENGKTADVIRSYYNNTQLSSSVYTGLVKNDKPHLIAAEIVTSEAGNIHTHNHPLKLRFEISVPFTNDSLAFSFQILNANQQSVLHFWVLSGKEMPFSQNGKYELECQIPESHLYMGRYSINTYLGENKGKELYEAISGILPFEVVMTGIDPGHSFGWQENTCIYREAHHWSFKKK
jgi:lipopolysaccharide transport system ATP-binding protein